MTTKLTLAIDPGTRDSAWVFLSPDLTVKGVGLDPNERVLKEVIGEGDYDDLVIEQIKSYGMAVGQEVFDTVLWSGRFLERAESFRHKPVTFVPRKKVCLYLCQSPRAKDSNVTQALVDLYGGSMQAAKGTKQAPGPLFGVKKDIWQALGLGVTYVEGGHLYERPKG